MRKFEGFEGKVGVTTDADFEVLTSQLAHYPVIGEVEAVKEGALFGLVAVSYLAEGYLYLLKYQVYTSRTPKGASCTYEFDRMK